MFLYTAFLLDVAFIYGVYSMQVDIIGGSLSGLATAISLKKSNPSVDVIIHEKHSKIGFNHEGRRCGEAHSLSFVSDFWTPPEDSICNVLKRGEVHCGSKVHRYSYSHSFMLNRPKFIAHLGSLAEELDVIIQKHDLVDDIHQLSSDFIVDASGCPSSVKRNLGLGLGDVALTYQQTLVDANCFESDIIKLYYMGKVGYFWIFPRRPERSEVNVGMGCSGLHHTQPLKRMLQSFMDDQQIRGKVDYVSGGLIPVGLQPPFMKENVLFVGDSGVGTFPLTGQGIYRALISGELAGSLLADGKSKYYPKKILEMFVKWEIICKFFMKSSSVARHIDERVVYWMINRLLSMTKASH